MERDQISSRPDAQAAGYTITEVSGFDLHELTRSREFTPGILGKVEDVGLRVHISAAK